MITGSKQKQILRDLPLCVAAKGKLCQIKTGLCSALAVAPACSFLNLERPLWISWTTKEGLEKVEFYHCNLKIRLLGSSMGRAWKLLHLKSKYKAGQNESQRDSPIRELRARGSRHPKVWAGMWTQRSTARIRLPGAEAAGAINVQEHWHGDFDKLLEMDCGLAG